MQEWACFCSDKEISFAGKGMYSEVPHISEGPSGLGSRETMSEAQLASLQAAVTELETWKEYLSGNITKIQDDEANYKSELNTFYLMWAGTPLPRLCLRDVH